MEKYEEAVVVWTTAIDLKTVGFNWETRKGYRTSEEYAYDSAKGGNTYLPWNDFEEYAAAPTLQQAQKWLREVKDIDIEITSHWDKEKNKRTYESICRKWKDGEHTDVVIGIDFYDTYEEAQEMAISDACIDLKMEERRK